MLCVGLYPCISCACPCVSVDVMCLFYMTSVYVHVCIGCVLHVFVYVCPRMYCLCIHVCGMSVNEHVSTCLSTSEVVCTCVIRVCVCDGSVSVHDVCLRISVQVMLCVSVCVCVGDAMSVGVFCCLFGMSVCVHVPWHVTVVSAWICWVCVCVCGSLPLSVACMGLCDAWSSCTAGSICVGGWPSCTFPLRPSLHLCV